MQVRFLKPGMTIRNPLGDEPWFLDLLAVSPVDADLMVTLTGVQGQIRVMLDTWADIDLDAFILLDEQQQHISPEDRW